VGRENFGTKLLKFGMQSKIDSSKFLDIDKLQIANFAGTCCWKVDKNKNAFRVAKSIKF
jgi:hypothetical protein